LTPWRWVMWKGTDTARRLPALIFRPRRRSRGVTLTSRSPARAGPRAADEGAARFPRVTPADPARPDL
jgi:hypothetical protein